MQRTRIRRVLFAYMRSSGFLRSEISVIAPLLRKIYRSLGITYVNIYTRKLVSPVAFDEMRGTFLIEDLIGEKYFRCNVYR